MSKAGLCCLLIECCTHSGSGSCQLELSWLPMASAPACRCCSHFRPASPLAGRRPLAPQRAAAPVAAQGRLQFLIKILAAACASKLAARAASKVGGPQGGCCCCCCCVHSRAFFLLDPTSLMPASAAAASAAACPGNCMGSVGLRVGQQAAPPAACPGAAMAQCAVPGRACAYPKGLPPALHPGWRSTLLPAPLASAPRPRAAAQGVAAEQLRGRLRAAPQQPKPPARLLLPARLPPGIHLVGGTFASCCR